MNIIEIEEAFIENFIYKKRRERSLLQLNHSKKRRGFIDKFNHSWEDMLIAKHLVKLNTKSDQETFSYLKKVLNMSNDELCYVISYDKNDGKMLDFKTAYENCQSIGFAGLIICKKGECFYLKTEQVSGTPDKFIGIKG